MKKSLEPAVVYTDGACLGNPGPGGWAAVVDAGIGKPIIVRGREAQTTNNRMELVAAIEGLRALGPQQRAIVYTDSEYLRKGASVWLPTWKRRGWRTRSGVVKNRDLWEALNVEMAARPVEWRRVAGHSGDRMNDLADATACEEAEFAA